MKVVINAGPLIALGKLGMVSLLRQLYESVLIPTGVYEEYVLLDDMLAREYAQGFGMKVRGTLGILAEACHKGLLNHLVGYFDGRG
ncbi:MAG: hypothetical protein EXR62_16790 [Chloroflexi bacterium]|nr:hypothetical protein [Chloroflexota bacterium]